MSAIPTFAPEIYVKDAAGKFATPAGLGNLIAPGTNSLSIDPASGKFLVTGVNVYFDATTPTAATIFDTESPPVTNNDALKNDSANTYYGTDGSVWTWNGTAYVTQTYSYPTHQTVDHIVATAGQVSFTLTKTPIGKVWCRRNTAGKQIAFDAVGNVVTYTPALNDGMTFDAGDWFEATYEAV